MSRGGGGLGWAFSSYSESSDNPFGHSFGTKGLPENSYLSNNDFRFENSKEFLISSLFYGAGLKNMDPEKARKYYKSVTFEDYFRSWNENSDKEWRKTTRAPYFDNKLPDFLRVFPVSAVVGMSCNFYQYLKNLINSYRCSNSIWVSHITSTQCSTWKASHVLWQYRLNSVTNPH